MALTVVCGVNWGDEGKGRMVDYLAAQSDVVVRYQGGNNAGHTVVNKFGTFKLHLVPSGVFRNHVDNVLGQGTVVDIEALCDEITTLSSAGISTDRIWISDRATVAFPFHRFEDGWEEERLKDGAYGSTRRGIAPAYGDRYLKKAVQVGTLLNEDALAKQLSGLVDWKQKIAQGVYGKKLQFSFDEVMDWCLTYGSKLKDRVIDASAFLQRADRAGKEILCEAQLGALRDVYFGIYPYTSSSCVLASFAQIGSGYFGSAPTEILGVVKAFSTCVGEGPFVTEMPQFEADGLREVALEYGAATGRPRRIGHFDGVASKYGVYLQSPTAIALTKLDSLSGRKLLKICTQYLAKGELLKSFPLTHVLQHAEPVYEEMPGWDEDVRLCREFSELPLNAQRYVLRIESLLGCPIKYVSVGPERDQLIVR